MADKIYKSKIGQEVSTEGIANTRLSNVASDLSEAEKTAIKDKLGAEFSATENEHGTHPAFSSQNEAIIWLLGNSGGGGGEPTAETLNAPEPITATSAGGDSININWTDTNS